MKNLIRSSIRIIISRLMLLYNNIRYSSEDTARRNIQSTSTKHNMETHPDEPYYAKQYLYWIMPKLEKQFPEKGIRILDIGCGQGRVTMPLSEWNQKGRVTGVDFTEKAIEMARKYSAQKGISNVEFVIEDVINFLGEAASESYDCVVFTEVIIFLPSYSEALRHIYRVIKPNGLAFVSFRSKYFNLLHTIRHRNFAGAKLAATKQSGKIFGGAVTFSWHTKNEIVELLSEIGFRDIICKGIGVCSGIEGDPLETIARPSLLSGNDQLELLDIEIQLAEMYADCGRYILAIATK